MRCHIILVCFFVFVQVNFLKAQDRTTEDGFLKEAKSLYYQNSFECSDSVFDVGSRKEMMLIFGYYSREIAKDYEPEINSLADFLYLNENLKVEIQLHTDSRGGVNYNTELSQRRAETIRYALIEKGIDQNRLTAGGYGETKLIISDEEINKIIDLEGKEKAHKVNRRVEILILANG